LSSFLSVAPVGIKQVRWDDFRWDTPQVRIEPIGEVPWAAEGALTRALAFLEEEMATLEIQKAS
jgi:hypothetical protein